jgi:hypothetical protein
MKTIVKLLALFRLRAKIRLFTREWKWEVGNPTAENVIFQLAVTIPPKIAGVDFEIFV